jgi:hypothetical protein
MHVFDRQDLRILGGRSPGDRDQSLAGCVGNQMKVEISRCARWHRFNQDRLYNLSMTGEKAMAFPGAQAQ